MTRPTMEELRLKVGAQQGGRYADIPGTGPIGMTCGDCAFLRNTGYSGKAYYKCGKTKYTHGDATTIKVRTAACRLFEPHAPKTPIEGTPS